mgnify:CR=1 FL=1
MNNFHSEDMEKLYEAILSLESIDECQKFFEDICTIKELQDISQRLEIALLLSEGKSYQEIAAAVGASTATIGRVSRSLNYGTGGYRMAIDRLKEDA